MRLHSLHVALVAEVGAYPEHYRRCRPRPIWTVCATLGRVYSSLSEIEGTKLSAMTSAGPSNVLFDDLFTINGIDVEGKKFDRGTRQSRSKTYVLTLY